VIDRAKPGFACGATRFHEDRIRGTVVPAFKIRLTGHSTGIIWNSLELHFNSLLNSNRYYTHLSACEKMFNLNDFRHPTRRPIRVDSGLGRLDAVHEMLQNGGADRGCHTDSFVGVLDDFLAQFVHALFTVSTHLCKRVPDPCFQGKGGTPPFDFNVQSGWDRRVMIVHLALPRQGLIARKLLKMTD